MFAEAITPALPWTQDVKVIVAIYAGCIAVSVSICLAMLGMRNKSLTNRIASVESRYNTEVLKLILLSKILSKFVAKSAAHAEFQNGVLHELLKQHGNEEHQVRLVVKELRSSEEEIERHLLEIEFIDAGDVSSKQAVLSQLSQAVGDIGTLELLKQIRSHKLDDKELLDQSIRVLEERLKSR